MSMPLTLVGDTLKMLRKLNLVMHIFPDMFKFLNSALVIGSYSIFVVFLVLSLLGL